MDMLDEFHRRFTASISFPLTNYLFNRRRIPRAFAELESMQWQSPEEIQQRQLQRLRARLSYAAQWVPFYERRFREIGLDPRDVRSLSDLRQIPPLTRQDVVEHRYELVDRRLLAAAHAADRRGPAGLSKPIPLAPFRKHKLIKESSSGSTGEPVVYYEDGSTKAASWAFEQLFKSWFDVLPYDREMRMNRLSSEFMPKQRQLRLRKLLWRQVQLPGMNLTEREYQLAWEVIRDYRPAAIWGFTSALAGLAEYMLDQGCTPPQQPRVVVTWAQPVNPHEVDVLQRAFGCHVTNLYSSHELGHLACRCPDGGLHVNQRDLLIEADADNMQLEDDGAGEILATTLFDSPVPFIRYKLGDVGRVGDSQCPCGRQLQVVENLIGRTYELFKTSDGRTISPLFWIHLFRRDHVAGFVKRFQITYRPDGEILIKVVKKDGYPLETEHEFRRLVRRNFGEATRLDWDYVNEITPEPSGKVPLVKYDQACRA